MSWWHFWTRRPVHGPPPETLANGRVMFDTGRVATRPEQVQAARQLEDLRRRLLRAETELIRHAHEDDRR